MDDYCDASALADELGITVSQLLGEADAAIERKLKTDGLDSIRGMTTRSVPRGNRTHVTISPALAAALRAEHRAGIIE
jgi:aryl carrier-like protein